MHFENILQAVGTDVAPKFFYTMDMHSFNSLTRLFKKRVRKKIEFSFVGL